MDEFYKIKYNIGVNTVEILSWPFATTNEIENGGPLDFHHAQVVVSLLDLDKSNLEILKIIRTIHLKLHFTKTEIVDFPEELFQDDRFNLQMLRNWLVNYKHDLMMKYDNHSLTFEEIY